MRFDQARQVADSVLYEGYVLYPYRASSTKNRARFQFGVLVPQDYELAGGSDRWWMQTECLVAPGDAPRLQLNVRCLQLQSRTVERLAADGWQRVEGLHVAGEDYATWDEGVEQLVEAENIDLVQMQGSEREIPFAWEARRETEGLTDESGQVGRLVRRRWPVSGRVTVAAEPAGELVKLRVRIENSTPWQDAPGAPRDAALRRSLLGAHTLLGVEDGAFVSLLDPPGKVAEIAAGCDNVGTWPVLIGDEDSCDTVLSSPIILYDFPAVAPESPGELFDATEIDEILTLRVMTLTEDEKREARATDRRARQVIDRSDAMPPEIMERLHGAVRSMQTASTSGNSDPSPGEPAVSQHGPDLTDFESMLDAETPPELDSVEIKSCRVGKGWQVRLQPTRRADSMDMFLKGRTARVEGVFRNLEDEVYVAVSLDDDPSGELHGTFGRFLYFAPDEIDPIAENPEPPA